MKWRPRSDLNTHRPLRRRLPSFGRGVLERANGVEPSRASLATMPRTMRARVLVPRDGLEPPFSANQALVLPLDERGVLNQAVAFVGHRTKWGDGVYLQHL